MERREEWRMTRKDDKMNMGRGKEKGNEKEVRNRIGVERKETGLREGNEIRLRKR